jgi:hypothetical protein
MSSQEDKASWGYVTLEAEQSIEAGLSTHLFRTVRNRP